MAQSTIDHHRLHASCTLVLKSDGNPFNCAACKRGSSQALRYSCDSCPFDLHGQCATSPEYLNFWGHPHHLLKLVDSGPDLEGIISPMKPEVARALVASSPAADGHIPVYCDICTNEIEGMHYQCAPCGVFLHPVCTQLPVTLPSSQAHHPDHELTLICTFPTMCRGCGTPGTWGYRCFRCLIHFHANCIPEYHHMLGYPYACLEQNGVPDRTRRFGRILPPMPPPPPRMYVNQEDPFAVVNPLGIMDPLMMPRTGPSTTPSVRANPCGGAFPYSGEYGRSAFGQ
ncbi:uncharacterized protein LOC120713705 [Panicum virgatum]|uniref:DC1 domain-containing protein n=1 Tax=Panicum virgatum TaxID=38727 RepID=A0A8T0RFF7_PANVG|nr:uncharacterized protein LOC120713705 [Panicum virgatum]KAG2584782.1 hypothetical protein PVAP13_6KG347700 [Panicum virgatum]